MHAFIAFSEMFERAAWDWDNFDSDGGGDDGTGGPPVKAILFLDVDRTVTKVDVSEVLGQAPSGFDDYIANDDIKEMLRHYNDLSNPTIRRLFDGLFPEQHRRNLVEFWRELHALGADLEVQMLSHDFEAVIELAFRLLKLEPLPAKIIGRHHLARLHNDKHARKEKYVRREVAARRPEFVMFVDDQPHQRDAVGSVLKMIQAEHDEVGEPFAFVVCCDEMTDGMSKADMDGFVRQLRDALPDKHTRAAERKRE